MEMEDRESTDSGSLSGNPDSESPPLSGGNYAGAAVPEVLNMNASMTGAAVMSARAVDGSGGGVMGGATADGGGGGGAVGGGGNGDLAAAKKKRGRPRKYDADGNLNPAYLRSPTAAQSGFTLSNPPSFEHSSGGRPSSGSKRGRGRPSSGGSGSASGGNWQILASLGELFVSTAGGDFTPHVVTVHPGEDVAGKILTFAQKGHRGICVLSANGSVSNVTLRQAGTSGGLLTYEGRFEILTLTGSYTISDNGGMKSRSGGLSVSLASPDGRVIGGGVAGLLMAASPIQIVVGSFVPNGFNFKPQKRKYNMENRTATGAPAVTVTAATPISQAAPETTIFHMPTSQPPQFMVQSRGEADNSLTNRDLPNSAGSTDSAHWNSSGPSPGQRPSPDINISVLVEDH